ncbi:MAG: DNA-3-methyladenine glycosylase family protein [Methyloligellaceae bacterium]
MTWSGQLIRSEEDIREGVEALKNSCKFARKMHRVTGDPPLRRRNGGFKGLARIVVGQQLSIASADAIWKRLEAKVKPFSYPQLAKFRDEDLKTLGLSGSKIRTLRAIAAAIESKELSFRKLASAHEDTVIDDLVAIKGIGPWTANIYTMFCLGRADSWAAGDLALQYATQDLMVLKEKPSSGELEDIAERWRPWRGVAARMLWSYYREVRNLKQGTPV